MIQLIGLYLQWAVCIVVLNWTECTGLANFALWNLKQHSVAPNQVLPWSVSA